MPKNNSKRTRTIKVDYLARVEGEGALYLHYDGEKVSNVQLKIFEPPRFFEALLRGRHCSEAADITARICGICPVAYQMSAVHAVEAALAIDIDPTVRTLRRVLYCGEWIESHLLHIYMLHAPDFLGFHDVVAMAKQFPDIVARGLRLKKIGNDIVNTIGGREIHPINVRVGGFYKIPDKIKLKALLETLSAALDAAIESVCWSATLEFPDYERPYEMLALGHGDEYAMNEGRLRSNFGLDIAADQFEDTIEEEHIEYSSALHARIKGRGAYIVGPIARFNMNYTMLPKSVQMLAENLGMQPTESNPFKSIIIRGLEVVFAFEEAIRLLKQVLASDQLPRMPNLDDFLPSTPVLGCAMTEAPRGTLYHRYEIDTQGLITSANIVPPTAQNQKSIEQDLADLVPQLDQADDQLLQHRCEQAIRNYDPCISCSAHFLKIHKRSL